MKQAAGSVHHRPQQRLRRVFGLIPAIALLFLSGRQLHSQQPPTLKVESKLVNMQATVRDKHGKIVNTLGQDDFLLEEDGRPQVIRYFSRETDLPLTLGLLVDTSGSQRNVLPQERTASHSFLARLLRPDKDLAFLIHFDEEVELLQDLTGSRDKLESALQQLQAPERGMRNRNTGPDQDPSRGRLGGTLLYDAVYLAADELMKRQPGRKALIVLSDGVDNGSKLSLETAIESAQRADTVVYSILFADEDHDYRGGYGGGGGMGRRGGRGGGMPPRYPREPHPDGKKILERLSRETGGRLFQVSKKQPIDQIYSQIEEELRNQYSIGYTPDRADAGPGYRKIHLAAKEKGLVVQTREGYFMEK